MADSESNLFSDQSCCLLGSASCEIISVDKILQDITKKESLPDYQTVIEDVVGFSWSFETKYYTCTVRLCKTTQPTLGNQQFADQLEAVILTFDPEKTESWTSVNAWLSYLEHLEPSVKILVCNSCSDTSIIPRKKIQQWCIDNEFELVELEPAEADPDEDEYDVDGVKRIIQIIHAHTWPNLVMKDKPDTVSPYMKQLMDETKLEEQHKAASNGVGSIDLESELGMQAQELSDALNNEGEEGVESFEKLFSKLQLMKEKAEGLSPDERKAYAEKVAMSFWTAIGGSDDEIHLTDSD